MPGSFWLYCCWRSASPGRRDSIPVSSTTPVRSDRDIGESEGARGGSSSPNLPGRSKLPWRSTPSRARPWRPARSIPRGFRGSSPSSKLASITRAGTIRVSSSQSRARTPDVFHPEGIVVLDRTIPERKQLLASRRSGTAARKPWSGRARNAPSRERARRDLPFRLVRVVRELFGGTRAGVHARSSAVGSGPIVVELAVRPHALRSASGARFENAAGRSLELQRPVRVRTPTARGCRQRSTWARPATASASPSKTPARAIRHDRSLLKGTSDSQLGAFQAAAQFGRYVASAGDVNGDGYGDVIIGAELYDRAR